MKTEIADLVEEINPVLDNIKAQDNNVSCVRVSKRLIDEDETEDGSLLGYKLEIVDHGPFFRWAVITDSQKREEEENEQSKAVANNA